MHIVLDTKLPGLIDRVDAIRAVADHNEYRWYLGSYPGKDPHHVHHALDGAEIGDVNHDALARELLSQHGRLRAPVELLRVDEVVDHLDFTPGAPEREDRFV